MLTKMKRSEKVAVMEQGWNDCLRNHLCGNYITLGKDEYEWFIDTAPRRYRLGIYGIGNIKYDFDFSFDENLQALYEWAIETLVKRGEMNWEDGDE